MPAWLLPKPPRRDPLTPSFLPGPKPRPALHALCHLLQPREPRRRTAAWVIPGTWAQARAHTPGTGGLFAHRTPPPPASRTHAESPASCSRVPRPPGRPEQAQGCACLLSGRRPGVQAPLRVPCPSPQETTVARARPPSTASPSCLAAAGKDRPPQATCSRRASPEEGGPGSPTPWKWQPGEATPARILPAPW
ncbi:unnamed protein product [Rangifer tarandus platyrhynchus]|uniref:Uncharacterized protein n=2 Tax=Rangifer tarandus platyrhynchus TaxID=3082113 RepID=A0ACB0E9K1_RANTA|nr:unnamed protein product [Rangifer tarandus platyrhynchus]CAI9697066.1 unnamed protein product [Rangifer tarandus platyrhynchus]